MGGIKYFPPVLIGESSQWMLLKLTVDTNILFSFFKKDSATRKIVTMIDLFEFYTLRSRFDELFKHKEEVCTRANITAEEFFKTLNEIRIFVETIEDEEVKRYGGEAKKLAPHEEDIPCFALALALNSPIWSNEKEFKNQDRIKVFSTSDLIDLLSKLEIEKWRIVGTGFKDMNIMSKLARSAAMVSSLLKAYNERTGCRTIGILVCDDATDKLLNLVKGLKNMRWCAQLGWP